MRIALTFNLRLSDSEDEAEFDTEETVNALANAIEETVFVQTPVDSDLDGKLDKVRIRLSRSRAVSRRLGLSGIWLSALRPSAAQPWHAWQSPFCV